MTQFNQSVSHGFRSSVVGLRRAFVASRRHHSRFPCFSHLCNCFFSHLQLPTTSRIKRKRSYRCFGRSFFLFSFLLFSLLKIAAPAFRSRYFSHLRDCRSLSPVVGLLRAMFCRAAVVSELETSSRRSRGLHPPAGQQDVAATSAVELRRCATVARRRSDANDDVEIIALSSRSTRDVVETRLS